jgi:hypothetical protein
MRRSSARPQCLAVSQVPGFRILEAIASRGLYPGLNLICHLLAPHCARLCVVAELADG